MIEKELTRFFLDRMNRSNYGDSLIHWEPTGFVLRNLAKSGNELFSEIPIKIDIKNEARVHLWYKDKFGRI